MWHTVPSPMPIWPPALHLYENFWKKEFVRAWKPGSRKHSFYFTGNGENAVQASKLRWRYVDPVAKPLTFAEVFYMGTLGGGSFFGKVGSFLPGYAFDALILDDSSLRQPRRLELLERLERFIYLGDDRNIAGKYINGVPVF